MKSLLRPSLVLLLASSGTAACGDDDPPAPDPVAIAIDGGGSDAGGDAEADAEPDAEPDTEPDAEPDTEPDAESDAEPDVEPECTADDASACDDGVACTVDVCDVEAGVCTNTVDDSACNDDLFCNGLEVCDAEAGCLPGEAVACDDGVGCTIDVCDEEADACAATTDDAACDNGSFCDGTETCDAELDCVSGEVVVCDDGVSCTVDSCDDEAGACVFDADDSACDNGLFCDGAESCDVELGCVDGEVPDCDDRTFCTEDSCDEEADVCAHAPNDLACDDGVFCDGFEVCDAELGCISGTPPICDDALECTIDICDEGAERCIALADHGSCDDGVFCDGAESCDLARGCVEGPVVDCDDGIDCTVDRCDEDGGRCLSISDHTVCDDGIFCDGTEFCSPSEGCIEGPAYDCDDGNDCTVELCDFDLDRCVVSALDADGDGAAPLRCGGEDCDDTTELFGPDVIEICDGEDQDCDEEEDEGVLNTCGTCDPTCNEAAFGESEEDFVLGDLYNLLWDDERGGGRVTGGYDIGPSLWVPNTAESTFSRWDTELGVELARYRVGIPAGECSSRCCWDNGCNMPSRVALDSAGNAYVANRGFSMQGTVTKVFADHDDCIDRNGNAIIDTSSGPTPLGWDADECVAWTVSVGPVNAVLRALTIDRGDEHRPEGYLWVGGYNNAVFYKLDPRTGETLLEVAVPSTPYGAVVLDDGMLWYSTLGGGVIGSIDTVTGVAGPTAVTTDAPGRSCGDTYGITADGEGRLWVAGWGCTDVIAYDPAADAWSRLPLDSRAGLSGRGLTVDPEGTVWVAQGGDGAGRIHSFPADSFVPGGLMDVTPSTILMPAGHDGPSGVCLDRDGFVWLGHHVTSQLVRIDRETGELTSYSGPNRAYTYSDFSGSVRQNVLSVAYYERTLDSGCDEVHWEELRWDADVPDGSSVTVFVRTADTGGELSGLAPTIAFDMADTEAPFDIGTFLNDEGLGHGRLLTLTIRLETADATESPVLTGIRSRWSCLDDAP